MYLGKKYHLRKWGGGAKVSIIWIIYTLLHCPVPTVVLKKSLLVIKASERNNSSNYEFIVAKTAIFIVNHQQNGIERLIVIAKGQAVLTCGVLYLCVRLCVLCSYLFNVGNEMGD